MALAVGRLLPGLTTGARWPFRIIGIGYALVAIAALIAGARRHVRTAGALRQGSFAELSSPLVMWLTAAAVLLSAGTIAVIAARL